MKFLLLIYMMLSGNSIDAQAQKPAINHLALHVQNLDKSLVFYRDIVGLDTIPEPFHDGNHIWFDLGSAQLHLIGAAKTIAIQSKQSHFCLSVASINVFIKRLEQWKVSYEDVKGMPNSITLRADGVKQIYFKDPDGYWIEINDAKN